ncbi:MAG: hypothetical protein ACRC6K_01375 [Fusobacteriaceae bacterium]
MNKDIINYLSNSKVVIIDDEYEEAQPLITGLKTIGISALHIAKIVEIKKTINGIRLIFLDIDLVAGAGNSHDRAGTIISFLKRILDKENGPYLILIWSKQSDIHKDILLERFDTLKDTEDKYLIPIDTLVLEKSNYLNSSQEKDIEIDEIIEKMDNFFKSQDINILDKYYLEIKQDLINFKSEKRTSFILNEKQLKKLMEEIYFLVEKNIDFKIFLAWEHMVKNEVINQGNEFFETKVREKFGNVLYNLAVAYSGQKLVDEKFMCSAFSVINNLLCDKLSNNAIISDEIKLLGDSFLENNEIKEEYKEDIPSQLKAILNKKLLINVVNSKIKNIFPGAVYKNNDEKNGDDFINGLYNSIINHKKTEKNKKIKSDIKGEMKGNIINLEISPSCDFSQNKIKYHRIIKGVLLSEETMKFTRINKEAHYCSQLVEINNKNCCLWFSFQHLYTEEKIDENNIEIILRLKNDFFKEIQIKLSNHISRLGVTSIH